MHWNEYGVGPTRRALRTWQVGCTLLCGIGLGWLGAMGCASSHKYEDMQLVSQAWGTIQKNYVDRADVQPKELTYGAISGMVDALGDTGHSTFLTPDMVRELKSMERGEVKGIGIEVQMKNGQVVVVAPIDGSPAQRAGLRPGDVILKVGAEDITDWQLSRVVEHILGPAGTSISLTIEDPHTSGTRVDRSHSVFLPVISFSPRCQPWSLQRTTIVSSARPVAASACSTRPTWASMNAVDAR